VKARWETVEALRADQVVFFPTERNIASRAVSCKMALVAGQPKERGQVHAMDT